MQFSMHGPFFINYLLPNLNFLRRLTVPVSFYKTTQEQEAYNFIILFERASTPQPSNCTIQKWLLQVLSFRQSQAPD